MLQITNEMKEDICNSLSNKLFKEILDIEYVDYFDVTTQDIAAYIGKHFVDGDAVAASIEDFLQKRL